MTSESSEQVASQADENRKQAEHCPKLASTAGDTFQKAQLLELAKIYDAFADEREKS